MQLIPLRFTDANGSVTTEIRNDGQNLSVTLRGVTFEAGSFEQFEALPGSDTTLLQQFTLEMNEPRSCRLEFELPVQVRSAQRNVPGTLTCRLDIGAPGENREELHMQLTFEQQAFESTTRSAYFDDQFRDLQQQLPDDTFLQACGNCRWSDYHPAGSSPFGSRLCFDGVQDAFVQVQTKADWFKLIATQERYVQETHLCDSFEPRPPSRGQQGTS